LRAIIRFVTLSSCRFGVCRELRPYRSSATDRLLRAYIGIKEHAATGHRARDGAIRFMRKPDRRAFVLGTASAVLLAGCGVTPKYTMRYRLKIDVASDGRRYSGSSVNEVGWIDSGILAGFDAVGQFGPVTKAEAPIVDLGHRGLLFALVWPPDAMGGFNASQPGAVLYEHLARGLKTTEAQRNGATLDGYGHLTGPYAVPPELWPTFIRFRDLADPASAELVERGGMEAVYGAGADVTAVTMQITRDPVTERIEHVLPWLRSRKGALKSGPWQPTISIAERITPRNFKLSGDVR
jgi:hypothetical protein